MEDDSGTSFFNTILLYSVDSFRQKDILSVSTATVFQSRGHSLKIKKLKTISVNIYFHNFVLLKI